LKIYTKTGDGGETSFFGGARAPKSHPRVAAYGDVDELNAALGVAVCTLEGHPELRRRVESIQKVLFGIGGEVATPGEGTKARLRGLVAGTDVEALEASIDAMESELPELKSFILPGGSPAGAALHVARTVCRRAERAVVGLAPSEVIRPEILRYLNRLSDWLFVAARWVNHRDGSSEVRW